MSSQGGDGVARWDSGLPRGRNEKREAEPYLAGSQGVLG